MKTSVWMGVIACAVVWVVACGSDEQVKNPGSGGKGGSAATDGGAASGGGGTGGTGATGGSGGGQGGTGGTGATGGTAGAAGAGGTPSAGKLLVAGTDFFSMTEVASVDLDTKAVVGDLTFQDGDAVPAASGGVGFVLERTLAKVHSLTADGAIDKTVDVGKTALGETGTDSSDPISVAVLPGGTKAYVLFGKANHVAIVDLAGGTLSGTIDLSSYMDANDADGWVDMGPAVHDASAHRVYFTLGRIDQTTVTPPNYELACPSVKALLLAVDTTSDTVADLNGSASGEGIELLLANPIDASLDATTSSLYVLSAGCFQASNRVMHGIDKVDLTTGSVTTAYTPQNQDYLARLLLLSPSTGLIDSFDPTYTEHWYTWTPQGGLGAEANGIPAAPSIDDATHLLGVEITPGDGGSSVDVVRYDGSANLETIVSSPWQGAFDSAAGTALVR